MAIQYIIWAGLPCPDFFRPIVQIMIAFYRGMKYNTKCIRV